MVKVFKLKNSSKLVTISDRIISHSMKIILYFMIMNTQNTS